MAYVPAADEIVPVSKSPGYIVLSYLVSYVGCLTALELLLRRTHHGGHYNWFLLGGAATAMGGVAIWSMHYIGMQAMIMANGEDELQLYYYASYTAGSFFLPIAVVALSFSVFSSSRRTSAWRIAVAGIFCGAAICGMHYVGQVGIVNYRSVWDWRYVVGSVVIAMGAATVALGVFFYLSSKWINALWKRALCALLLAGAVCLMHWTAVLGTSFQWKGLDTSLPPGLSKTGAVWVCGALALSCCLVLFALAVIFQYVRRAYARKAQQISLALAYFAPDGSIMLNNGGHLPLNRITKNYLHYSAKDNFDIDTAPFAWMYRVSRNWACVKDLLPSMRLHIQREQGADNASIASAKGAKPYSYATVLKELYCLAAEDLAHAVGFQISQVGFLFDRLLNTGRMTPHIKMFTQAAPTITTDSDFEGGPRLMTTLTRGQVLFLVRHLDFAETTHLQTIGYSFAPVRSVASSIAASMQITAEELRPYLDDLAAYKEMPQMLDAGVHLAMFVVKPIIGGFEVLARRSIRNQLPSVSLPIKKLEAWQLSLLIQYDNWEASALLQYWSLDSTRKSLTQEQHELIIAMCDALVELQARVGDRVFERARLVAKPLSEPGVNDKIQGAGTATILAFKCVTDIHYVHPAISPDIFINARLFTTQQHCYPGSSDHAVFSGRVHTEFATVPGIGDHGTKHGLAEELTAERRRKLLKRPFSFPNASKTESTSEISPTTETDYSTRRSSATGMNQTRSLSTTGEYRNSEEQVIGDYDQADNVSEKYLVPNISRTTSDPSSDIVGQKPRSFFGNGGGVHVSNEIHITVADAETASTGMIEMGRLGMKTEIGTVVERESAVDILMALTLGGLRN